MADIQTWGLLPKAQDDSTTISSAISAAIAAHNSDPDAHTAAGQALDLHRVNDVLDHPAGSVVGDKISNIEVVATSNFDGSAGWAMHGNFVPAFANLIVAVYGNQSGNSYGYLSSLSFAFNDDGTVADNLLQIAFYYVYTYHTADIVVGLGPTSTLVWPYLVFKISSGNLTFRMNVAGTELASSPVALSQWKQHVIRFQSSQADQKIYCYLDGDLVHTFDLSTPPDGGFYPFGILMAKLGGTTVGQYTEFYAQQMTVVSPVL